MAGAEETLHRKAHSVNVTMNATHDPRRQSWVLSANRPGGAFPIQNLPFGVLQGLRGLRLGLLLETRFWICAAARDCWRRCRRPRWRPVPRHAQSADGARSGVLVCSARPAQRSASSRSSPGCRSSAGAGAAFGGDGRRHHAEAGGDRRLHGLLCLDRPRQECGQAVSSGQSSFA